MKYLTKKRKAEIFKRFMEGESSFELAYYWRLDQLETEDVIREFCKMKPSEARKILKGVKNGD